MSESPPPRFFVLSQPGGPAGDTRRLSFVNPCRQLLGVAVSGAGESEIWQDCTVDLGKPLAKGDNFVFLCLCVATYIHCVARETEGAVENKV